MKLVTANFCIQALPTAHNRQNFSCGVPALDYYLHCHAKQEAKKHVAATFVLTELNSSIICGYYTLSAITITAGELPPAIAKKAPKYPLLPATLLGRLAVTKHHQGNGLGELLLIDALSRSVKSSNEIASMAIIVNAKNDKAIAFYTKYGFIRLANQKNKLLLPMATACQACSSLTIQHAPKPLFSPSNHNIG